MDGNLKQQMVEPAMQENEKNNSKRNADGTFPEGVSGNPSGTNGHQAGWQRYGDRLQKFLDLPYEDLVLLCANKAKFRKLSSIDRASASQALAIGKGSRQSRERELGIDRIEGRATQKLLTNMSPFTVEIKK